MQKKGIEVNKRKQLIAAALTVFAKHGYDMTTVDEIAAKAGIAKGTVYHHFKSKEDVFLAIVEEGIQQFKTTLKEKTDGIDDPVKKMDHLIVTQIGYIVEYQDFFKVLLSEWWNMESRWSKSAKEIERTYFSITEEIIEEGQRRRLFTKEINTDVAAMSLFWLVATSTMNYVTYKQQYSLPLLEKTIHRLVLHALRP